MAESSPNKFGPPNDNCCQRAEQGLYDAFFVMAKGWVCLLLAVLVGCYDSNSSVAPSGRPGAEVAPQTSGNPTTNPSATDAEHASDSVKIVLAKRTGEGDGPVIEVVGLGDEKLATLSDPEFDENRWAKLLTVSVVAETRTDETAMLGEHRVNKNVLRFTPRFALEPGLKYRAVFDPAHLPGESSKNEAVVHVFELPKPPPGPPTLLTSVYPSGSGLPENQLKFYFHFSASMSRGEAYQRIHLFDASGKEVKLPFLELGEELWDRENKRFTLLFDPGRIKKGLKPREEEGPSVEEGNSYTLKIEKDWLDAAGQPLKTSYQKKFRVVAADNRQPHPKYWKLDVPLAESTQPLTVVFEEPLDQGMLERVLAVIDETGNFVDGEIEIDRQETRWRLNPDRPWNAGRYQLTVDTTLEDLAGNSIARPFEVDLSRADDRLVREKTVSLPFQVPSRDEADASGAGEELNRLFELEWEQELADEPTSASRLGDLRYNTKWPDLNQTAIDQRHAHRREILKQLDAFNVDGLSPVDRVNYRLFRHRYASAVEAHQYQWYLLPITQRGGIQDASSLANSLSFETVKHYEDWIARMRAFPAYMNQTIALMRAGIEKKMVHPQVVMKRVPAQIARQIVKDPSQSLFFKPFRRFPNSISKADRERLIREAKQTIAADVVEAYQRLQTFFEKEYLPACSQRVGVWQLPRGRELYAFRARRFTTTPLTPQQIHERGVKEVARIRAEMQKVIQQVEFKGTFKEFLEFLRTDSQFYYKNANDLLEASRAVCKKIDPQLVKLFHKLPRMPYGVESIPMHLAPDTTTAYYRRPSANGSRAGTYFVNLYKPEVRPKYEIEALSLHEAVPGHHLQISLAMELENLPAFRRYSGYTAFIEGWGLYSESLGEELGLYKDPYSKFGQLTYEMWRAVRLVVDTGMHSFQWPRQKAIDFFADNTAKTLHDIENEIDRYIAWPGQALAYKVGELKITELCTRAKDALGPKFNIRDFHNVVLSNGAVTLDVLESNVDEWIDSVQRAKG